MAGLEYTYRIYNYQTNQDSALNDMAVAGWHVHTAVPAYTEVCILWERGGVSRAASMDLHLGQVKQAEAGWQVSEPDPRPTVPATAGPPEPAPEPAPEPEIPVVEAPVRVIPPEDASASG
jgi:hypothetical protein